MSWNHLLKSDGSIVKDKEKTCRIRSKFSRRKDFQSRCHRASGLVQYAKYEILFIRMGFKEPKDKKVKRSHRIAVLSVCKLSYKKIIEFEREYVKNMYVSMKQSEFDNLIKEFKANNSN